MRTHNHTKNKEVDGKTLRISSLKPSYKSDSQGPGPPLISTRSLYIAGSVTRGRARDTDEFDLKEVVKGARFLATMKVDVFHDVFSHADTGKRAQLVSRR
jgi:hypothetical protein